MTTKFIETVLQTSVPKRGAWHALSKMDFKFASETTVKLLDGDSYNSIDAIIKLKFNDGGYWIIKNMELSNRQQSVSFELIYSSDSLISMKSPSSHTISLIERLDDVTETTIMWTVRSSAEHFQTKQIDMLLRELNHFLRKKLHDETVFLVNHSDLYDRQEQVRKAASTFGCFVIRMSEEDYDPMSKLLEWVREHRFRIGGKNDGRTDYIVWKRKLPLFMPNPNPSPIRNGIRGDFHSKVGVELVTNSVEVLKRLSDMIGRVFCAQIETDGSEKSIQAMGRLQAIYASNPREVIDNQVEAENRVEIFKYLYYESGASMGAHQDASAITISIQEEGGGIEVQHPVSKEWIRIVVPYPSLVVFIGMPLDKLYAPAQYRVRPVLSQRVALQFHVGYKDANQTIDIPGL